MENYFEAKSLLFKNLVKENGVSVLNKDDDKYEALKECSKARVISYGVNKEADYRAINIKIVLVVHNLIWFIQVTCIQ